MIIFNAVSKRYSSGANALQNVSLHIKHGEMVFLTGHSGAGKSSLLKIAALTEHHTGGEVLVNGIPYQSLSKQQAPYVRRRIGKIFQNPKLLFDRNIFDNVALPLLICGYRQQEIARRVRASLDKVGLLPKERFYPSHLSAGEKQRIGIARAVVHKPQLILADEPTGNLDPDLSIEIMQLFHDFNQVGVTVLVATHDVSLIEAFQKPILTLSAGKLL